MNPVAKDLTPLSEGVGSKGPLRLARFSSQSQSQSQSLAALTTQTIHQTRSRRQSLNLSINDEPEGVQPLGTVPKTISHVNDDLEASTSSRASIIPQAFQIAQSNSPSNSTRAPKLAKDGAAPTPTPPSTKMKIDIKKLFQNPSSMPASQPNPSDTMPSASSRLLSNPEPSSSSQLIADLFTPFVPRPQGGNSATGVGPPAQSPSYNQMIQNTMSGHQLGPPPYNGADAGQPRGSSGMPSPMPQMQHHMQPGMPMGWSPYYYPAADEQQQYMYGWYGHIPPGPVLPSTPVPTPVPNPETPSISHVEAGSTIHADAMPSPRLQHIDTHRAPDSHPLPPHDQPISAPRPPHDRPIPAPRSPHDRLTPMPRPPIRLNFPRATPLDIYLQLVKQKLTPSNFRLKRWKQYQSRIAETNEDTTFIVLQIAQRLRTHPRLLHGANCLIQPRYRIHCSTTATEVKHFVLIDPPDPMAFCKIYSFENESFAVNLRSHDIKQLLVKDVEWERQIESSPDEEWLACVAEILREIIDDARTEDSSRSMARTRLHRLGKAGILPPSIFIHFVDSNIPQYESMIEHSISGGFCDAHRITIDGVAVCFRVLRQWENLDSNKEVYRPFSRELSIWHQLKHPNILPLIGATMEIFPKRYCFLVPWLSNGPITHFIKTHPEHDKYLAISQIADGLDYLHNLDPPVGHKDIKGDNILVNADLVCVITDFGLSSILEEQRSMTRGRGTQYWSAPELGTGPLDQDSRPRDVFSFGCTVSEILLVAVPKDIWWTVIKMQPLILPPYRATEWNSEEQQLWQVAECCLQVLPEDRPLIVEIKRQITTIRSIVTSVPLEQDHGSETSSLSEGSAQTLLGRLYIYVRNFFHM